MGCASAYDGRAERSPMITVLGMTANLSPHPHNVSRGDRHEHVVTEDLGQNGDATHWGYFRERPDRDRLVFCAG